MRNSSYATQVEKTMNSKVTKQT